MYRRVRHRGSKRIVCFRPALVYNPRRLERLEIALTANAMDYDHAVRRA